MNEPRGIEVHVPIDPPYTDREELMLKRIERLEHRVKVLEGIQAGSGLMVAKIVSEKR